MFSYIIAMQFLSWALTILMLIGFGLFKFWEYGAKNSENDVIRKGVQMMVEEFYSSNFAGKVIKLLFFGALFFSTLISVIRGDLDE
jgi:hypothetical protein